eukprot:TRINITY_DN20371_c0_g1_i1.p1 TRINITY_DN20371_c0_g1~~TRINITY_DN20371_c0_g1_i1.p1  ORF type:complete len:482 (+),score=184.17 TRINITY_DN20371_c0_g1_i1:82-1527(+)
MYTIEVRVPGASAEVLQMKDKGGVEGMIIECQRKLRMHVPMTLCSADEDGKDLSLLGELEPVMCLVPRFPKGTLVRAQGMQKTPELNGKSGKVLLEKEGRYGVLFDDGTKGLLSGVNIAAIDEKGEAAQKALQQLLAMEPREAGDAEAEGNAEEAASADAASAPEEEDAPAANAPKPKAKKINLPKGPVSREAQIGLVERLCAEFTDMSAKNATGVMAKCNWDYDRARVYLTGDAPPAAKGAEKKDVKDLEEQAAPAKVPRDEQKRLLETLRVEFSTTPLKDVGRALVKSAWDLEKARTRLNKMKAKAKAKDLDADEAAVAPEGTNETASGAGDNPGHRRMEKDQSVGGADGADGVDGLVRYTCRKCRRPLCSSEDVKPHDPTSEKGKKEFKQKHGAVRWTYSECGSLFLEEGRLAWVQAQTVDLKGDLFCPTQGCRWKVGTYNWTGAQCSCGVWVNPAIQMQHSKMDRFVDPTAGVSEGA